MQKNKVRFRHYIEYILLNFFIILVRITPLPVLVIHRQILGFLFKNLSPRHRRIVKKNLKIAFPSASTAESKQLFDRIYHHFSVVFVQIITLFAKKKPTKVIKTIKINGLNNLQHALEKNRGVILYSAHLGNWELIPYVLSRSLNTRVSSIARPMNNPLVERKLLDFRNFMGSRIIYKKGSIRKTIKLLKDNQIFYYLIDHNAVAREGVFIDFFSKKACAITSVAQLHLKMNVCVIPVFLHYEADKIVVDIFEEVETSKTSTGSKDIFDLTQRFSSLIEEQIRAYPEQWFWFHDRWRTKPPRREQ